MGDKVAQRVDVVDILRGVALLGIIIVHFMHWHVAGPIPENIYTARYNAIDLHIKWWCDTLLSDKFILLFSLLFGLSFSLLISSLEYRDMPIPKIFSWRLLLLFFIGLIHQMFWMGDILFIYAILGFFMLFMKKRSDNMLFLAAIFLICNIPGIALQFGEHSWQTNALTFNTPGAKIKSNIFYDLMQHGTLLDFIRYNLHAIPGKIKFHIVSGRLFTISGFFLLGLWSGRTHIVSRLKYSPPAKQYRYLATGLIACIICYCIHNSLASIWPLVLIKMLADAIKNALIAILYAALVILFFQRNRFHNWGNGLAAVGKMALTNYLLQTVAGLILFYPFGLHLFLVTSSVQNLFLALGVFALQVIFSYYWMKYFLYGPVEWLWRTATYGKRQKIRRATYSKPKHIPISDAGEQQMIILP
ncbi:MAG: DUF418 domain-containing protein [Flavipsychrobacter sp.]|nr:DUF418 domain-containing protein [Flavipsychrobacter sp.]